MDNAKKAALAAIDEKNELIAEVADSIWDYEELSMQEVKSAALFVKVLKEEGFQVEEGICGIPTAFSASYGSGKPVIGFLAEYDALSGLSQEAGSTEYHELVKGGSGHGCGHIGDLLTVQLHPSLLHQAASLLLGGHQAALEHQLQHPDRPVSQIAGVQGGGGHVGLVASLGE